MQVTCLNVFVFIFTVVVRINMIVFQEAQQCFGKQTPGEKIV